MNASPVIKQHYYANPNQIESGEDSTAGSVTYGGSVSVWG